MLNVLLSHLHTREEILISLPADWEPWQVFRHVRTKYPEFCFLESWEASSAVGGAIAAYVDGMGDLLKYCRDTAIAKLGDVDAETIRCSTASLFIAASRKFNL